MKYFLVCFLLFFAFFASAQKDWLAARSTQHSKIVDFRRDTVLLDSFPIIYNTFQLFDSQGFKLDTAFYKLQGKRLVFTRKIETLRRLDSLKLRGLATYRVLPFQLERAIAHKDTTWFLGGQRDPKDWYAYTAQRDAARTVLEARGLDYSGSLTRGISVGNAQDLVLNSQFNLQLGGKLGDDIEIKGAISDQNIPLQPEGNTQRLQQFDKIFLQIKRHKTILNIGDYELQRPQSYFVNYFRRLQGVSLETTIGNLPKGAVNDWTDKSSETRLNAAVAVARGKFARNIITPLEGNQGPYKLRGNNGERFLIVLANTEHVYIDGRQLKRGIDNDYTINYNSGEVIFTAKQLITKDKRITVEFSYTEQNFLRYVAAANASYQTGRLRAHFHLYNESDNKTSPQQSLLTDTAVQRHLSNIGDSLQYAYYSGVRADSIYDSKSIQYYQHDTLIFNRRFTIYSLNTIYTDNRIKLYTLTFTEIGQGRGNYILKTNNTINGRVYAWIAPDSLTGQLRGAYEPVVQLVTPKSQQIYSAGLDYSINKHLQLQSEVSLSNKDVNLFSERDKADNTGLAAALNILGKWEMGDAKKENNAVLTTRANYEYVQKTFNSIDPYRSVEFSRDWNTTTLNSINSSINTDEHLLNWNVEYKSSERGLQRIVPQNALQKDSISAKKDSFLLQSPSVFSAAYTVASLIKPDFYKGINQTLVVFYQKSNWEIKSKTSYLTSKGLRENTDFVRPNIDISTYLGKKIGAKIGVYGEAERNLRKSPTSDSLQTGSQQYYFYRAYLQSTDSLAFQWSAFYQRRNDWGRSLVGDAARLKEATVADDINGSGAYKIAKSQQLRWNFTYRKLTILDSTLTDTKKPQDTYLGRMDYTGRWFDNAVVLQSVYELGNGQEQRLEYTYIEVPAGQGQYAWFDRNNNGVRELNEFEISSFQDQAKFVRLSTFTGKYVRSNIANATQILSLTPSSYWRVSPTSWQAFLNRFSSQTSVQINRKTLDAAGVQAWNPYQLNIADSTLVSNLSNIRQSIFFNRMDNEWGIDWTWQDNFSKQVLTSGAESRRKTEHILRGRYNPLPAWNTSLEAGLGVKENASQLFKDRDYAIDFYTATPKLTWIYKQNWRVVAAYTYANNRNKLGNNEQALSNNLTAEATYSPKSGSSLQAKMSFVNMDFQGIANSPVGFALLEGLQNGKNFLWSVIWDKKITKNLQLSLSYEGRKTGDNATLVHVGRMQVRAIF